MSLEALGDLVSRAPTDEGAHRMLVDYLDEHGHPMLADVLRKGTWAKAPTSTDKTWWQPKEDDDELRVSLDLSHHPLLNSARVYSVVRASGKDDPDQRYIVLHFKHAPNHTFSFADLPAYESKQLRQEQGVMNRKVELSRETEDALWRRWAQNPEDEGARGYLADYLAEAGSPLEPLVRKAEIRLMPTNFESNNFSVIRNNSWSKSNRAFFRHNHPTIRSIFLFPDPDMKYMTVGLRGNRTHEIKSRLTYPEMKAIYKHLRDNHKTDKNEFQEFYPEPEVTVRRVELARKKPIPTPGQLFAAFRDVLKSPLMLGRNVPKE